MASLVDAAKEQIEKDQAVSPMAFFAKDENGQYIKGVEPQLYVFEDVVKEGVEYVTISDPDDEYKPSINVRINHPDLNLEIFENFIEEDRDRQKEILDEILEPLQKLPALNNIKEEVNNLVNLALINNKRKEMNLKVKKTGMHMVFTGKPGTGKTVISRLLGNIFYQIGFLNKGHVVEVDSATLTGEYIGWSASKTKLACQTAEEGILFIDEAYTLTDNIYSFGYESVNVLTKHMEDFADNMIVIVAGYPNEMENFLRSNSGLRSRFSKTINFEDYNYNDMIEIFKIFCEKNDYFLGEGTEEKLSSCLNSIRGKDLDRFGNARGVRNLFDSVITRQSERILKQNISTKEGFMELMPQDIPNDKILFKGKVAYFPNN